MNDLKRKRFVAGWNPFDEFQIVGIAGWKPIGTIAKRKDDGSTKETAYFFIKREESDSEDEAPKTTFGASTGDDETESGTELLAEWGKALANGSGARIRTWPARNDGKPDGERIAARFLVTDDGTEYASYGFGKDSDSATADMDLTTETIREAFGNEPKTNS